ncbi:MAG: ABC transporter substrate-binding protein [Acetobacteraceae bacterium]
MQQLVPGSRRAGATAPALALALSLGLFVLPVTAHAGAASKVTTATTVADFGGIEGLITAARQEGELNVIALPPDWTDYGLMIKTFEQKYGIKIHSAQPDADSQDEINAAKRLRGQKRAPDVFDLGINVALFDAALFAPYKVAAWNEIPAELKDPDARWYADYGGYSSIGYDAKRVPPITSFDDLLKPEFRGKVALNGNPTRASAGFHGVMMAALANGGSADDIAPGVTFFHKLNKAGNFLPVDPTPATVASGQTPVVIDWEYLNLAERNEDKGSIDWKVFIPPGAVVGAYYVQAINKDAPHPAAARLWEEFLYSAEGQNIYLKGYARPVLLSAMIKAGTVDKAALAQLPKVVGKPVILTQGELKKGQQYLLQDWDQAVQ